jgi:hypothetical protein
VFPPDGDFEPRTGHLLRELNLAHASIESLQGLEKLVV